MTLRDSWEKLKYEIKTAIIWLPLILFIGIFVTICSSNNNKAELHEKCKQFCEVNDAEISEFNYHEMKCTCSQ